MNPLTNPDSPEVVAALGHPCRKCGAQVDEYCRDTTVRIAEIPRLLRDSKTADGRLVHLYRTASDPAPQPRKPRTRKPPVRRAPVSAAKPIEIEAKDIRRRK